MAETTVGTVDTVDTAHTAPSNTASASLPTSSPPSSSESSPEASPESPHNNPHTDTTENATRPSRLNFVRNAIKERRNRRRIALEIAIRFLDSNGNERTGQLTNISGSGIAVRSEHRPPLESPIVCYLDSLGGYEGVVCRHLGDGFAVQFVSTKKTQEKLVERIMAAANNMYDDINQARRHVRVAVEQEAHFDLEDGTQHPCTVIDLSAGGLGVRCDTKPPLGTKVQIGKMKGEVIRHLDDGFAVQFVEQMTFDRLCSRTLSAALFHSPFQKS